MDKLKMQTADLIDENIVKIGEIFPNCLTESKDANGETISRAIDFDLLKQELSGKIVEGQEERYQINWPGKREALLTANAPILKTLRPVPEESVDFENTKNIFIEGDNLDALKLLQESYLGKIKMIYIDPPYNTGNDFIYEDDFAVNKDEYLAQSGQVDEDGNRLKSNPETNGRFHSDWLSMMYPRLKLARKLLRDDGVIFISIDDWEVGNLRIITDEVFGRNNFIGLFCRRTKSGGGSAAGTCAVEHDYVLAFAKVNEITPPLATKFSEKYLERYKESDEIGSFFWDTMERSSTKTKPYKIAAPDGQLLSGKWFRSEATFKKDLKDGEVRFLKKTDGWSVQFKQRLSETKKLRTIFEEIDLTQNEFRSLNAELEELIEVGIGHPPKPVELIKNLAFSVSPNPKPDIILDFFAGSATSAHSVMQLNAEDGGNRQFILVQLPEECEPKSEAFKAGYKNIAEISKERIRRAGQKIKSENPETTNNLDIGFRVLKVDTTNMKDVFYTPQQTNQAELFKLVDNIKEDRSDLDLLFQVFIDWAIPLDQKIIPQKINNCQCYLVNKEPIDLLASFADNIDDETIKQIAALNPAKAIFRDGSFKTPSSKINCGQYFKQLSPNTEVKFL